MQAKIKTNKKTNTWTNKRIFLKKVQRQIQKTNTKTDELTIKKYLPRSGDANPAWSDG